jgi:hypothetical protein
MVSVAGERGHMQEPADPGGGGCADAAASARAQDTEPSHASPAQACGARVRVRRARKSISGYLNQLINIISINQIHKAT